VGISAANKWPTPVDVFNTAVEDIFMRAIRSPLPTGGRNHIQYILQEGWRDKIINAHYKFLKVFWVGRGLIGYGVILAMCVVDLAYRS